MKPSLRMVLSLLVASTLAPAARAEQARTVPPAPAAKPTEMPARWTDARLIAFMRALAQSVYARHVVLDESRPTFGMTYELWRGGRQYQDFGLDSMHDGAWFTSAMATADRADPAGDYLKRALRYQVPFYLHVLRDSDKLFPEIVKTPEDRAPLTHPVRGRLPLAWDDGGGFDLNTGKRHLPHYNTTQGPNHLAQDVADALLNVWLTRRDPALAEALRLLYQERLTDFGTIPVLAFAAGLTNDRSDWIAASKLPGFTPGAMPGYAGLYQQNGEYLSPYDDPLAWQYGQAMAEAARSGRMDPAFVSYAAARVYGHQLEMQLFYADRPWPPGLHFFDIQGPPRFLPGTGRLDDYAATSRRIMGGRGIEIAWVAAGILPELRRHPEVWEAYYRRHHPEDALVRIVDEPPVVDGKKDAAYPARPQLRSATTSVRLVSDVRGLGVLVESTAPAVRLVLRHAEPVSGEDVAGRIEVRADGGVSASNSRGESLRCDHVVRTGKRWTAELYLPYSVVPGQQQWINGVENGRYRVELEGAPPREVYLLSEPRRIVRALERYVDGTIRTWSGVWNELGVIPSGYRGPNARNPFWELSDTGNYAHLIRLISLRLLDRRGESEWQVVRQRHPQPAAPLDQPPDTAPSASNRR